MNVRRSDNGKHLSPLPDGLMTVAERSVLNERAFRRMIALERKRTERSRMPFLLMLLDMGERPSSESQEKTLEKILSALSVSTRETDVTGWYRDNCTIGVMFTEIQNDARDSLLHTLVTRVSLTLQNNLTLEQFNQVSISFHIYPEDWGEQAGGRPSNPTLYPDLQEQEKRHRLFSATKRLVDVLASVAALLLLSPLFLIIAIAIKLCSRGPVFFRQQRIGQHGTPFTFLKFRSMYMNNDPSIHREYVKRLIAGTAEKQPSSSKGEGHYKLTRDARITAVGSWLRRSSLDELPQLVNVLAGQMSLVGPRPPLPYEVESYQAWHRRRILEVKPGITGLWQVSGRSRVKFDEMVRLDLQYARSWSPWLDLKIMLRTPRAVFMGEGAY